MHKYSKNTYLYQHVYYECYLNFISELDIDECFRTLRFIGKRVFLEFFNLDIFIATTLSVPDGFGTVKYGADECKTNERNEVPFQIPV